MLQTVTTSNPRHARSPEHNHAKFVFYSWLEKKQFMLKINTIEIPFRLIVYEWDIVNGEKWNEDLTKTSCAITKTHIRYYLDRGIHGLALSYKHRTKVQVGMMPDDNVSCRVPLQREILSDENRRGNTKSWLVNARLQYDSFNNQHKNDRKGAQSIWNVVQE